MEDGDCTEISAQLIRRHTPCRGGYQPPANVANLWAEPIWPGNVAILQNIPCFDMIPPNFIAKCSILPLSALCADVVSHGETTGRLIDAPTQTYRIAPGDHWILIRCAGYNPYERPEIFAAVIRRHTPCRGGYQPPANVANLWAEPIWPGNVAILQNIPCFDIIQPNFICKCSVVPLSAHCADVVSHGETTGRILSAPTNSIVVALPQITCWVQYWRGRIEMTLCGWCR